jgi:predicted transcriptional regulator
VVGGLTSQLVMEKEKINKLFQEYQLKEKLNFIENVEKGLKQLDEGKTVPHEKVKEMVKKWVMQNTCGNKN